MNTLAAHFAAEQWAMLPKDIEAFLTQVASIPADQAFFDDGESGKDAAELDVRDGVAHIPIRGTIMKSVPRIFKRFGIGATGTLETQDLISKALDDQRVTAIQLDVESPGGVVKGVDELAQMIFDARGEKPISAHATDLMASAAYWVASQAERITANAMCTAGSIGVYTTALDSSAAAEKQGVKVHVISSHELKGAGMPGTRLTDAQLADMQRLVDQYAARFNAAVARGRGHQDHVVKASATGQVWLADEAKERGLIDDVLTAQAAHEEAAASSVNNNRGASRAQMENTMSANSNPTAVTVESLSADLEKMKKDLEAAEAARKNSADALAKVEADRKTAVIEAAVKEGRVAPTQRAMVDARAATCAATELEAELAQWPKHTQPVAIGSSGDPTTTTKAQTEADTARAAQVYQAEQAAKGIVVSATAAVDHVLANKAG